MTESTADRPLPRFPEGFLWGTSTSAYQIEGAVHEGGRGASIWDTFAHTGGRIADGSTADTACDFFHRWESDLDLLSELGVNAYRFSLAWPRIQPDGTGPGLEAGFDYYDRLIDALDRRGIKPIPTLYHWDLPQTLEDKGGWLDRETAYRFADYAGVVGEHFAGRVEQIHTINEAFIHIALGYALGLHAPGLALGFDAMPAGHHLMLAHGLATPVLRELGYQVGVAHNLTIVLPGSDSPEDLAAAHAYDLVHNRFYCDPLFLGRYPDLSPIGIQGTPAFVQGGDMEIITAGRPDVLGINYYNPTRVGALPADEEPTAALALGLPFQMLPIEGVPHTAFGWPVVPEGLRDLLLQLKERYGDALPPAVVTENGCSTEDVVDADGSVHDPARIAFLDGHLRALHEAVEGGVDVAGYMHWSLLDNFEWDQGYQQRFGLIRVDFDTLERTPKDSYHWYRAAIAAQRDGAA